MEKVGSSLKSPNKKGELGQGMHLSMVAPSLPRHHDSFLSMGAHAPSAEEPHMHTTQLLYRWEVARPPKGVGPGSDDSVVLRGQEM